MHREPVNQRKKYMQRIARERIEILYGLAQEAALRGEEDRARRYVEHMINLSRKYNVRIPRHMKRHFCKKCHTFLIPGKTAQVRLKKGKVVIKCLRCGNYKRYVYRR
jgi:ribonuclease P protein subunit RPR2